jgi:hypothetical protein
MYRESFSDLILRSIGGTWDPWKPSSAPRRVLWHEPTDVIQVQINCEATCRAASHLGQCNTLQHGATSNGDRTLKSTFQHFNICNSILSIYIHIKIHINTWIHTYRGNTCRPYLAFALNRLWRTIRERPHHPRGDEIGGRLGTSHPLFDA